MMTEYTPHTQTLLERDALSPSAPEPERTTDDVIIRGVDTYKEELLEKIEDSYDEQVEALFTQEVTDFHTLLDFKVKGEIVAQLFKARPEGVANGSINLTEVRAVLTNHIAQAMESNNHQAQYIDNVAIPKARTRFEAPVKTIPGDIHYLNKDIPLLEAREDSYMKMVEYLNVLQPSTVDDSYDLAEAYIARILPEARQEAIDILKLQKEQAEAEKKKAEAAQQKAELKIEQLETTIDTLQVELAETREEVAQRDVQMFDAEMEDHLSTVDDLTEEAKRLAA